MNKEIKCMYNETQRLVNIYENSESLYNLYTEEDVDIIRDKIVLAIKNNDEYIIKMMQEER